MRKRLISIAVVLSIVASLFTVNMYSSAATSYVSPNMAILENILYGDRQFVLDTLIGTNFKTDFSTNPHALVNYIGDENTMMDNVLSQYQNEDNPDYNAAYKIAVDIMEKVYNGDDYIQHATDWVTSFAADLLSIFSSDAQTVMDDLTYSVSQLQYESILKEVLATDYTASDGTTLSTKEIELENLERLDKGLKNLKSFSNAFKSSASANHMNDGTFGDRMDYYNNYLVPYATSIESALSAFADAQGTTDASDLASFVTNLALVAQMDRYEHANEEISSDIVYTAPTFFIDDDTLSTIKGVDTAISTVSKTLSTYMFINSIGTQKEAVGDTLTRMSKTANPYLKPIFIKFANEVGEAGNAKLVGYESLMKYLRDAGAVKELGDWTAEKIEDKISDYLGYAFEYSDAGLAKTAVSTVLSKATNVAGISSWCADATMSFGDTCKKTYELKYLRTLIAQAIVTYEDDLEVYLANKTEENAENVLDDLLMIQKLRLRGETIAYNMTYGQWNSALGRLLASGTLNQDEMLLDYLKDAYQSRVDAFIGASAMPLTSDSLTIRNGETLTVNYSADMGGLYATYIKADKTSRGIGELKYKIASGITVQSGGRLTINVPSADVYMPYITNNGGEVLFVSGNVKFSQYSQKSGSLKVAPNTYNLGSLYISGGTVEATSAATMNCKNITLSGTPDISNISVVADGCSVSNSWNLSGNTLTVNKSAYISGSVTGGNVYFKGDSSGGSGTIENLYISGSGSQTLSGTLNATNLVYNNTGTAKQPGTIYVSGTVKNTSSKVTNGQNTVLQSTGSIIGDHYNSGLTLDGVSLDKAISFDGTLKTLNAVTLEAVNISGGLIQSGGTLNLNGNVIISGDSYFAGTVTQNENSYCASGDISVSGTNAFNNITTNGKLLQTLTGTINVTNFTNANTKGLSIVNELNVSGILTNTGGKMSGMGITLLSGGSFGNGDLYDGDITIQSTCDIPSKLSGDVVISAINTINKDTNINGYLTANSGSIKLEDASLTVDGKFILSVPLMADETSSIICNSAFTNNNTITGNSTPITIKGIMQNNSTLTDCLITCHKELINTGTISGGDVVVNSELYNSGTITVKNTTLHTNAIVDVSGNSISTENLTLSGNGKVNLKTTVNVSQTYLNNNNVEINEEKLVLSMGKVITSNKNYTKLDQTTDLIIDGCTVSIDVLNLTAGIKLTNGAKLIVNRKLIASSSKTIEIDETSSLELNKLSKISSYSNILVDGRLLLGSDSVLTSTKLSGSGIISVKGDLYGSSLTINQPNTFEIIGKTPQIISCSNADFYNLNILNNSRKGVTFSNSVNYYGDYNKNDSNVTGTVTQK